MPVNALKIMSLPQKMTFPPRNVVPVLSVSGVNDLGCPRKYKHTRIDGNWGKRDPILAVSHGSAVHLVLHGLYNDRMDGLLNLSRLEARAKEAVWSTRYPAGTDRGLATGRVTASVQAFVDADDEEAIKGTLDTERTGRFPVLDKRTGNVLFLVTATLDRLFCRGSERERLIIRESKTTAQRISLRECFLMLWVARKMYPGFQSYAIEYDFLDEDMRVVRETVEEKDVAGQSGIILSQALQVFYGDDFPAVPGLGICKYCPLRENCTALEGEQVDGQAFFQRF